MNANLTQTGTKFGNLVEFIADRKAQCPENEEQYEAFCVEFYGMVEQIVRTRENAFSLQSQITLPRLKRDAAMIAAFTAWALEYQDWLTRLFSFEKRTLATALVTWN